MPRTLLTLPLATLLFTIAAPGTAQEPKQDEPAAKEVKLRWYGQSMFQLETARRIRIVIDPHAIPAFGRALLTADFVLVSHPHNDHSQVEVLDPKPKDADVYHGVVEGKTGKQDWKSVNERRGPVVFRNLGTFHDAVNGMQRGKNSVWIIETDGLVFCHLGDLGHELTAEQVKAIGKVDVLMIPVGGIYTINGEQARKTVAQIKPRLYVIPMHYAVPGYDDLIGPDEFLEDQDPKRVKKMPSTNELVIPLDMKADAPTTVLLGWKKEEPKKKEELKKK